MNYPISQLVAVGGNITYYAQKLKTVASELDSVNSAIISCYGQGGVGGRIQSVAQKVRSQALLLDNLGNAATSAAELYHTAESNIGSAVYSTSGETYTPPKFSTEHTVVVNSGDSKIVSKVKEWVGYYDHGAAYDIWEYGKAALKIGKGVVKIVGVAGTIAAAVTAVSTGVGAPAAMAALPVAITSAISAGNDMINAATDIAAVATDQYEVVGTQNILKDTLVKNSGDLGEILGNREAGELFGELTYTGLDIVSFLDGADKMVKAYGKVNTDLLGPKSSFVWGDADYKDIFDNEFDGLSKLSFEKLIKENILGMHPDSTGAFITDAAERTVKFYFKGNSLAEKLVEIAVG